MKKLITRFRYALRSPASLARAPSPAMATNSPLACSARTMAIFCSCSSFLAVLFVAGLLPMQAQAALPGARSYINGVAGTGFGDVYLGGNYIQFGVAANGSSGKVATPVATANAALPGGTTPFYTRRTGNFMGFLGDADGFGVGKDLRIDYFLPGSPAEGWGVGYNDGTNNSAYNSNSVTGIAGYAFTNTSSGNTLQATGTGIYNSALTIQQVISFDVNSKAVRYDITLTNNTASTMNNVRFLRLVDADNTVDLSGSYTTVNTVVNQGGVGQNAILEAKSQAGDAYQILAGSQAVLQYFSADSRARVFHSSAQYGPYDAMYAAPPATGSTVTGDTWMSIWFEETNLAAGASTTFTYYAVMRATGGVVSTDPNTDYVFSSNDFQFQPPIASLTTVKITTIPTVGTLYLDANSNGTVDGGETVIANQDIPVASLTQLKFKPAAGATETSNYDSFIFQVNGDTSTTYTMTVGIVITVPDAPIIGAATPGNGSASIAFTPSAYNGGSPITGYTASCTGGASTPGTGLSSPLTVTGMTNDTTYSCSVTATNAKGTSAPSGTVSVTPTATPSAAVPVIVTTGGGGSVGPFGLALGLLLLALRRLRRDTLAVVAVAVLMVWPLAASAADGWYAGGQIGQARGEVNGADVDAGLAALGIATSQSSSVSDMNRSAWRLFGGYRLAPHLAIEGGYVDLGETDTQIYPSTTVSLDTIRRIMPASGRGVELAVLGLWPLNERTELHGRVGLWRWKERYHISTPDETRNVYGTDAVFGFGVQYRLTGQWQLRGSLDRYRVDDQSVDFWAIGAVYSFL